MTLTDKEPGTLVSTESDAPRTPPPPMGETPESGGAGQILRLLIALALVSGLFLVAGLGDLLLFIAILIVIVMLHELAHFATAKWAGMQVTQFFVGFGPRLWSVKKGETEYGVKAIPAGGFVKITGFTVLDEVAEEDEARTYRQQPFYKRIIVASAGSAMHFLIALILALIVAFSFGVGTNNISVSALDHWKGVAQTPAQAVGLKAGDTIVSVNGAGFKSPLTLTKDIGRSVGKPITLGVERNGHLIHLTVTPANGRGITDKETGQKLKAGHGYIGFSPAQATTTPGLGTGVGNAFTNVGSAVSQEVRGVGELFSASGLHSFYTQVTNSKAAAKASSHPATDLRPVSLVGIASLGVQSQKEGLYALLELLIGINVIFGLLNMLPMIPLDGGHVAVAAYEWIRTRKGKPYYKADITKLFPIVAAFLAFLAIFVLGALYLDITHPIQLH